MENKVLNKEVLQNIKNRYSIEHLYKIYEDDETISIFSKKTWIIIFCISCFLFFFSILFDSVALSLIAFCFGMYSVYSISKIVSYRDGAREGIGGGYDYGVKYHSLDLLKHDMKDTYSHLWYLLYPDGCFWDNNDDKELERYLKMKMKEEEPEIEQRIKREKTIG